MDSGWKEKVKIVATCDGAAQNTISFPADFHDESDGITLSFDVSPKIAEEFLALCQCRERQAKDVLRQLVESYIGRLQQMDGSLEVMSPAQQQAFLIEIQHDSVIMKSILQGKDP
jgi:hypothetical protein